MKIQILCGEITGKIYAANVDKRGNIKEKIDVTHQVINAVIQHMGHYERGIQLHSRGFGFVPKAIESTE
jgi:hypothetical protein